MRELTPAELFTRLSLAGEQVAMVEDLLGQVLQAEEKLRSALQVAALLRHELGALRADVVGQGGSHG